MSLIERPIRLTSFQFHKGTIRTVCCDLTIFDNGNFNSIKVRLELYHHGRYVDDFFYFNSIKVRLELYHHGRYVDDFFYFNSIKVRLELFDRNITALQIAFQFHKGTIRTVLVWFGCRSIRISIP